MVKVNLFVRAAIEMLFCPANYDIAFQRFGKLWLFFGKTRNWSLFLQNDVVAVVVVVVVVVVVEQATNKRWQIIIKNDRMARRDLNNQCPSQNFQKLTFILEYKVRGPKLQNISIANNEGNLYWLNILVKKKLILGLKLLFKVRMLPPPQPN